LLVDPPLYLITDDRQDAERVVAVVEAACAAGCRFVQLRRPGSSARELWLLAKTLRETTRAAGAMLAVNDRADVALDCDADALHLPAAGLTPERARSLVGSTMRLGRSVHSIDEVRALANAPVDYLQFGPIYETPSKRPFGPPQGIDALARVVAAAGKRPVVAVGGIDVERVPAILSAGARGVAVIGAVVRARDAYAATAALIERLGAR
jgi:thiamine-phosphate pyrophosphorylase